jgi:hypothetical protein
MGGGCVSRNWNGFSVKWLVAVAIVCALAVMAACNSGSSAKKEARESKHAASIDTAPAGNAVIGADYCLQTFMTKANTLPGPVHFVYAASNSDGESKKWEGDVTATTADFSMFSSQPATPDLAQNSAYKVHDGVADFTNTLHYTRSEDHQWAMAPTMPVQTATPWSEFVSKPPIDRVGSDTVNGFEAVKYTVDNSKQSKMERVGFVPIEDFNFNGTVWLLKDTGCILQWKMDATTTHKDGKATKVHYEGTVTKK